jgi:hypothetical protein
VRVGSAKDAGEALPMEGVATEVLIVNVTCVLFLNFNMHCDVREHPDFFMMV